MDDSILVNFHCHSIFSDGSQSPEVLAGFLSSAGVRYAALTDHDTLEGLPRFQEALKKNGIGYLPGVELTTHLNGIEVHLLGYGFDPENPEVLTTLQNLRQVKGLEVHSIADSLRKSGTSPVDRDQSLSISAAPNGSLDVEGAISLIHRAGGQVFWAHPLTYSTDLEILDRQIADLKIKGLDGIEAIYAAYSENEQSNLKTLAIKHNLLICAGTDFHNTSNTGSLPYGIRMPRDVWTKFRDAVFSSPIFNPGNHLARDKETTAENQSQQFVKGHHFKRRTFSLRILLPTFIAIALFLGAFWGFILPSFEQTLLERKREMIKELTNSAVSILASYQRDEQQGILSREEAQALAITRVEALRYGPEGKDYFWIQDEQPVMIMHPYRPDLNGNELYSFVDPRGVRIFVEFAALVQREGDGYIDYVWQWKDDPQRLEPKESYVKGFEPWGWIVGTGIYIDDVDREIAMIEKNLTTTSLVIFGTIVLLLLFVLQQSLRIEKERQEVVDNLHESNSRYHSLVEATTEGTLLVLDQHIRYANPKILSMLGYTENQLEFLDLFDLLPPDPNNAAILDRIHGFQGDSLALGESVEGCLKRKDGSLLECILALNPIQYAGQNGFILLAKDVTLQPDAVNRDGLAQAAINAPIGVFRARAARQGTFLEINSAGRALLPFSTGPRDSQPSLADLFADHSEFDHVFQTILNNGGIRNHILHIVTGVAETRTVSLTANLVRDEIEQPAFISGILEDISAASRKEAGREALIDRLQSSLLFLHEPIAHLGRDVLICGMDTSIEQLARMMTARGLTAALVSSGVDTVIGIITDHDLRERALAENIDHNAPIHTIMSSPITKISDQALLYEALMKMEEKGVRHLAVEDANGQIVSVIDSKSLIQFQRYGPIVLAREISRSKTTEDVARYCDRRSLLAKTLLDSSARPRPVTNMLTSICDAATEKLINLAMEKLGPPPAEFSFIAMGSQGRQEQTLVTDQDNGIIYLDSSTSDDAQLKKYFLDLGTFVCEGLNQAGYLYCQGKVMANNPHWCRSLSDWQARFNEWIQIPEPQEMIDLNIFFDFRPVYGDDELTQSLHRHIHKTLSETPSFFPLLAQNTLSFKPPLRLPGNLFLSGGAVDHAGEINLKDAMMPIISFARLYALKHQINQTHTLERIEELTQRNIILPSSREEIIAAYDQIMRLRLESQLAASLTGQVPQNIILPGKLGYSQQELLKQAFAQVSAIQKKVSYDFLGGISQ